jgi:hypothetical protein
MEQQKTSVAFVIVIAVVRKLELAPAKIAHAQNVTVEQLEFVTVASKEMCLLRKRNKGSSCL